MTSLNILYASFFLTRHKIDIKVHLEERGLRTRPGELKTVQSICKLAKPGSHAWVRSAKKLEGCV